MDISSKVILFMCGVGLVFCMVNLFRNEMIYRYRTRASNIANHLCIRAIRERDEDFLWGFLWYDSAPNYRKMVLDWRKWKFKDFYLNLPYSRY